MFTCASLFASFLNMLPRASAAGVSAFTYQSIDQTNTPYSKQKEPFRSIVKNDVCMSVLRYLLAGFRKNMNQPLELQLGFLRPTDFAHPRSKSNRICTLPETYSGSTHFSHLGGRSFSRRLSFHLSSQTRYRE